MHWLNSLAPASSLRDFHVVYSVLPSTLLNCAGGFLHLPSEVQFTLTLTPSFSDGSRLYSELYFQGTAAQTHENSAKGAMRSQKCHPASWWEKNPVEFSSWKVDPNKSGKQIDAVVCWCLISDGWIEASNPCSPPKFSGLPEV